MHMRGVDGVVLLSKAFGLGLSGRVLLCRKMSAIKAE